MTNTTILLPNLSRRQHNSKSFDEAKRTKNHHNWFGFKKAFSLLAIAATVLFSGFHTAEAVPTLSVSANSTYVYEGTTARFTFSKSGAGHVSTFSFSVSAPANFLKCASCYANSKTYPSAYIPYSNWGTSVTWGVLTVNDYTDEANGSIVLSLVDGPSYNLGTNSSATIAVYDNDSPKITVTAAASSVTEGTSVVFNISKDSTATAVGDVFYNVRKTGDFVSCTNCSGQKLRLSMSISDTLVTRTFNTTDDNVDELNGSITLTLMENSTYTLGLSSTRSTTVTIQDNDVPTVSVSSSGNINEGGTVNFQISKNSTVNDVLVNYNVSETGSFITSGCDCKGNKTINLSASATTSALIPINTYDDNIDEPDGRITLSIRDISTSYSVSMTSGSRNVAVYDNDLATVTVSRVSSASVNEGADVVFRIHKASSTNSVDVRYNVSQVGDFIASTCLCSGNKNVEIPRTSSTTGYIDRTITTDNDDDSESNGSITLSILTHSPYITGSQTTATVSVNDNDLPEITISRASDQTSTVTEGGDVKFQLSSSTSASNWSTVSVRIEVTQTSKDPFMDGDFLKNTTAGTRTETMSSNSKLLRLETDDDNVREHNGEIIVEIINPLSSPTYTLGSEHTAKVTIVDNDSTTLNNTKHVNISLTGPEETEENGSATFTLSATWDGLPATVRRSACVDISDGSRTYISRIGNYWKSSLTYDGRTYTPTTPVYCTTFEGVSSTSFSVAIGNNSDYESDGTLTARIYWDGRNAQYSSSTVSVKVRDDDGPVISIARDAASYSESQTAEFTLTASRAASTWDLTIKVELSETGSFLSGSGRIKDVNMRIGSSTGELDVQLDDDDDLETDGSVTATITLKDTTGYVIAPGYLASATVTVTDNDAETPEISIFPVVGFAEEGSQVSFKLVLSGAGANSLTVNYSLVDASGYLTSSNLNRTETVGAGIQSKTFNVSTSSRSGVMTALATITATIGSGTNYRVATAPDNTASVQLLDSSWPSIDINAGVASVTEGNDALFLLSLSAGVYLQSDDILINFSVSDPGNYISGSPLVSDTLPAWNSSKVIRIPTVGDSEFEASNKITVTIVPGTGYQPDSSESGRVASVTVHDNDHDTQYFSITAVKNSVVEGETVVFEIIAPAAQTAEQTIPYSITPNFLTSSVSDSGTATIPANKQRVLVEFPTSPVQGNVGFGTVVAIISTSLNADYWGTTVTVTKSGPMPGLSPGIRSFPEISIKGLADQVTEGENAVFAVTANRFVVDNLSIRIGFTQSGDFVSSGLDRTVQLSGIGAVVAMATDDDETDESDGRLTATVLSGDGYVVSQSSNAGVDVLDNDGADDDRSVEIAGAIDSIQPAILEDVVSGVYSAFNRRSGQAFDQTLTTSFFLSGKDTLQDMLTHSGGLVNSGSISLSDIIDGSSFLIDVLPGGNGVLGSVSVWGFGNHDDISRHGSGEEFSWNGGMTSGQVGMDALVGEELLIGFASSFSKSEMDYASRRNATTDEGIYFSNTVGMHPYVGWSTRDGASNLHGSIGYGSGEISVSQKGYAAETTDTEFQMALLSGSSLLYSSSPAHLISTDGINELRVRGDAWLVRQDVMNNSGLINSMSFEDQRVFLAAEVSHQSVLSHGARIELLTSAGIAWDKTNHGHRSGLEVVGDFKYDNQFGLELTGSGGGTLGYVTEFSNFGLSGSIDFDTGKDGLEELFTLSPRWGMSADWNKKLRMNRDLVNGDVLSVENSNGVGAEVGYGVGFHDTWILTPQVGVDVSSLGTKYLLGGSLSSGSDLNFSLDLSESALSNAETEHKVELVGKWKW